MGRDGRDRRAASPSREARTALLSRIAQQRAEKQNAAVTRAVTREAAAIETAHAAPLPESDEDEDNAAEEFFDSEGKKFPEAADSSISPGHQSWRMPLGDESGENLNGVLDSMRGLSLENSRASRSSSAVRSSTASSSSSISTECRPSSYAHGRNVNEPVELSSDDEESPGRIVEQSRQKSKAPVLSPETLSHGGSAYLDSEAQPKDKELDDRQIGSSENCDLVFGDGSTNYILSRKIASKLYNHQRSGIRWLWSLHLKRMGGILGDDMGLGKTMQVAAFFAGLFHCKLIRTAMVVAPKTVIPHWIKELSSVGLGAKTHCFVEASVRVRERALLNVLQMGGVLITTYDMVRCNFATLRGDAHGRDGYGDTSEVITTWDYIVLDEGHLIKNPSTARSKGLRELPSTHRIIISGTPIQNNLKEMWVLMDFCCPGLLGDHKEFKQKYERQIVEGNDKYASDRMKRLGAAVAQELRQKLAPFFLRRMKSEVFPEEAESTEVRKLSRKNDLIVWLQLTPRQAHLYKAFLESEAVENALATKNALTALSVLKKLCDHPCLLTKKAADNIAEGMEDLESEERAEAEAMGASLAASVGEEAGYKDVHDISASCKINFVLVLLEKLFEEGHRTLIFSQTRKMLNIIEEELEERGWNYCRIDGTFKSSEREVAVKDFQSNPDIPFFLLTSQVGGLGLTLTAADRVVIIDPAWNPSVDNQSVDRAYRIGQERDVIVYRLMTCGTIEEKIYRKQVFKGGLMKVATETKNQMRYFSQEELRALFSVPPTGFSVSVTQKQLAEAHFGEHQTTRFLEDHIRFIEGLSMIAGVSHHDLLYSKAAPPLAPADDEDDTKVSWESRNPAYHGKQFRPASQVEETYTWDPSNAAGSRLPSSGVDVFDESKHAWLRLSFNRDKMRRLAAMLEDEETLSKLPDGGTKIMKKIKELAETIEPLKSKAATYEASLSPEGDGRRGSKSDSTDVSSLSPVENHVIDPRRAPPVAAGSGKAAMKVRGPSGNNIYNTAQGGADLRKPGGPLAAGARVDENLEDVMNALKV